MKRSIAILFSILLCALVLMSAISPAQADITDYRWIGACYYGSDPFYPATVVAYETGSNATLIVSVDSWVGPPINDYILANVSAVKVGFDWGINYTSTECSEASPVQVPPHQVRVFTVSFTVPPTTVASNFVVHEYTIYVEHVNSTTGPKEIVGTWTDSGDDFAVYSADQADARKLYTELDTRLGVNPYFYSYEARMLEDEAETELSLGNDARDLGDFAAAKTHYENGLSALDSAFAAELDYVAARDEISLAGDEAYANYYNAMANATMKEADAAMKQADAAVTEAEAAMIEANATMKQADAAVNQSYAWILFGIGFVFMGIATIIYASKKPAARARKAA